MKQLAIVGCIFMAVFIQTSLQNPLQKRQVSDFPEPNSEVEQNVIQDTTKSSNTDNTNIDQNVSDSNFNVLDDSYDLTDLFAKSVAAQTFELFEFEYKENQPQKREKRGLGKFFKRLEHSIKKRIDAILPVVVNAAVQKYGR